MITNAAVIMVALLALPVLGFSGSAAIMVSSSSLALAAVFREGRRR